MQRRARLERAAEWYEVLKALFTRYGRPPVAIVLSEPTVASNGTATT
jgi:hypothetical protein